MVANLWRRPAQLTAALLLTGLLYVMYMTWNGDLSSTLDRLEVTIRPRPGHSGLVKDAHRLPTADAFLPHFKAVAQIPGMTIKEAKAGCQWPITEKVNFMFGEESDWVEKDRSDEELDARRKEWQAYVENAMLPYSDFQDRFDGRGIIIVAGNNKSLKRVRVILKALKKLGSTLPIELHYWDSEMTPEAQKDIASMWPEMYFNDLSHPSNIIKTNHDGFFKVNYQLKTAAVVNSRFAELLLLDSDNIPVIDPALLFESAVYQEYGTVFWPDISRSRPSNPMWPITNTACRMDEYELESGQLLVDKRRYFYHLQLAAWINNEHVVYYYDFLLGDKDMFRLAWHALKTQFGKPKKWLASAGTLYEDHYCGHSFAQHHPDDDRVAFLHGGLVKTIPKEVMKWQREDRGGIFQVYKRAEFDENPEVNVNIGIIWDPVKYMPNRPEDLETQWCTDMYDVVPRPMDEIVPEFEKTLEEIGGYWMVEE